MASSTTTTSQAIYSQASNEVGLPRITIKYCTQCRWMLRAAYFAQELLSTFSTTIGEIALIPSTGGVFTIHITYSSSPSTTAPSSPPPNPTPIPTTIQTLQLWDRKTDGGFPEVKHLKQLVRNAIDPSRDLGHVDRNHHDRNQEKKSGKKQEEQQPEQEEALVAAAAPRDGDKREGKEEPGGDKCDDCV